MSIRSFTEEVIAQVKSRSVLWDKKHEMYGNIQAMDYEWSKLCVLLKRDKEFLKKRWRRLRDVFRIEVKKLKAPENPTQPLMTYYTGIWPHFESMLFLKDSLTRRTPRLFFPEETDETIEALLNNTTISNPNITLIENATTVDINSTLNTNKTLHTLNHSSAVLADNSSIQDDASPETFEEVDEDEFEEKPLYVSVETAWSDAEHSLNKLETRGVKRKAEDWGVVMDEDVNFAKSIVGYLRRLNPIKKLMVRNEIQSILLRELLCDKCRCKGQQKVCQCE